MRSYIVVQLTKNGNQQNCRYKMVGEFYRCYRYFQQWANNPGQQHVLSSLLLFVIMIRSASAKPNRSTDRPTEPSNHQQRLWYNATYTSRPWPKKLRKRLKRNRNKRIHKSQWLLFTSFSIFYFIFFLHIIIMIVATKFV